MPRITSIVPAEPGWKALYDDESQSRILAWAVLDSGESVGLVVDPVDKRAIIPVTEARSPDGDAFTRYGFAAR